MEQMGYVVSERRMAHAKKQALEYAESKYQEVDLEWDYPNERGFSPPLPEIGRDRYHTRDALSQMQATFKNQWWQCLCLTRLSMRLANTPMGRVIAQAQDAEEVFDLGT